MTKRALILGFDGFDLELVRMFGAARLPNIHGWMERGAFAALESVLPPATLPNWASFLTGLDPARHGVFDFTTRRGYRVHFSGGTVREAPTIFSRLDALGLRTACLGFPGTYPPEPLKRGLFMSGWDAPVAFEADRSFVHPPSLHDELEARFGSIRFDDVDEFHADREGFHDELGDALVRRIEKKLALSSYLLARYELDVFAIYFGESDTASHHLYSLFDERSPRNPGRVNDGLERVYMALDRAAGELMRIWPDAELTIVSDHGSGGSSDRVLYLNRVLEDAGFLAFKKSAAGSSRAVKLMKDLALRALPPKLRETIFHFGDALLPSWLESQARFGSIDFSRTRAFSDELNYFPAIHLNIEGREPKGIIAPSAREATIRELERALLALRDPDNGQPIVRRVFRREELFEGPYLDRAPDLLLDLHLREGYSYNVMPSTPDRSSPPIATIPPDEYLGRKGRSMPGSHREHGFFLAYGPSIAPAGEIDAAIADATATLLARLGIRNLPDAKGRVLFEIFDDLVEADRELPAAPAMPRREGNSSFLERRLRALGYVD